PGGVSFVRQDDWHALVDRTHPLIRRRGQHRAGLDHLAALSLPLLPHARQREELALSHGEEERLLLPVSIPSAIGRHGPDEKLPWSRPPASHWPALSLGTPHGRVVTHQEPGGRRRTPERKPRGCPG